MAAQSASMQYQPGFQPPQAGAFAPSAFDSSPSPVQSYYAGPPVTQATQQQAFPGQYHGVNGSTSMGLGGNMPGMMMHAGGAAAAAGGGGQPQFYPQTSTPYSQSVPAQVPAIAAQQLQQQQQFQQPSSRTSASPQPQLSPNAGNRPPSTHHTPPAKYPMAAPPLPQTPANQMLPQQQLPQQQQQHHAQAVGGIGNAAPVPKSPQSPMSQGREQQRIALLFEINVDLIQEVQRLQTAGQGGAISPQQAAQLRNEGKPDKMATEEYIQCLRRLQANLAYLMPKTSPDQSKAPPGPAHMTPPPHMPQLQAQYEQLRELFPGWPGLDQRPSVSSSSPKPNGVAA